MTARLPPALALAYLQQLSVGVRAAAVLDEAGGVLAGDAGVAAAVRHGDDRVVLAQAPSGLAIAVLAEPGALRPLLEHDLAAIAADLAAPVADDG